MNQTLKIDDRAFGEGVKDVLRLKPLVKAGRAWIKTAPVKESAKPTGKGMTFVRQKSR